MRNMGIFVLLVSCLALLMLTSCEIIVNQSSNDSQNNSIDPNTVYPQTWATGDGTANNPWANDCIKKAYDAVPSGGTIFLQAGYYQLNSSLGLSKAITIIGEGMGNTIIRTANADGLHISYDNIVLKNFTIDGNAQTNGIEEICPIEIHNCDFVTLENIETKNAGWSGIVSYGVNNATFKNIHTHDNYAIGFHPGTGIAGRNINNTYQDIFAYNNGQSGFDDAGNEANNTIQCNNVYDNLQCWDNGEQGIVIDDLAGGVLSNSFATGNGETGIYLYNLEDFDILDCTSILNGLEGTYLSASKNVSFKNVISNNNNVSNTNYIGGIIVKNGTGIVFDSCQSYDDRETIIQEYALSISGATDVITLINCKLTPNEKGTINNYSSPLAEIIIIEETRLAKL